MSGLSCKLFASYYCVLVLVMVMEVEDSSSFSPSRSRRLTRESYLRDMTVEDPNGRTREVTEGRKRSKAVERFWDVGVAVKGELLVVMVPKWPCLGGCNEDVQVKVRAGNESFATPVSSIRLERRVRKADSGRRDGTPANTERR